MCRCHPRPRRRRISPWLPGSLDCTSTWIPFFFIEKRFDSAALLWGTWVFRSFYRMGFLIVMRGIGGRVVFYPVKLVCDDLTGLVRRTIVHDDEFNVVVVPKENGVQTRFNVLGVVVAGHDNGYFFHGHSPVLRTYPWLSRPQQDKVFWNDSCFFLRAVNVVALSSWCD